jgi:hypothetical protein
MHVATMHLDDGHSTIVEKQHQTEFSYERAVDTTDGIQWVTVVRCFWYVILFSRLLATHQHSATAIRPKDVEGGLIFEDEYRVDI